MFDVISSKKALNANTLTFVEDGTPYVTRTAQNNGRQGYIDRPDDEHINSGNVLTFGMDVNVCFYQPDDFAVGNRVKLMIPRNWNMNETRALMFVGQINKNFADINWGDTCNTESIKNAPLYIIADMYGYPDWEIMEHYIRAEEKRAIRQIDAFRESEISTAKKIINDSTY